MLHFFFEGFPNHPIYILKQSKDEPLHLLPLRLPALEPLDRHALGLHIDPRHHRGVDPTCGSQQLTSSKHIHDDYKYTSL